MPSQASKRASHVPSGRARILQAGLDLAAESGPSGMTINQVCQRARVKAPAIYYHFGSKEGLLGAVVETVTEAWLDQLEASQPARGDLAERLRVAVDGWQAMIEDPARPIKLLLSVQIDGAEHSAEVEASLRRVYERARQLIAGSIRAAAGEVAEVDVLADQVLGLVQAAALAFHLESDRERLRARLRAIARLIETHLAYAALGPSTHSPLPAEKG
ncbi:MAG: TetR/AcrR family transcriptional regulator [Polyangiales bacterium]